MTPRSVTFKIFTDAHYLGVGITRQTHCLFLCSVKLPLHRLIIFRNSGEFSDVNLVTESLAIVTGIRGIGVGRETMNVVF